MRQVRSYFVYQCFMDGSEKLYKSGLTETEADQAWNELDSLIANGGCGNGCAVKASLEEKSDFWVAKRLGLLDLTKEIFSEIEEMKTKNIGVGDMADSLTGKFGISTDIARQWITTVALCQSFRLGFEDIKEVEWLMS